MAEVLIKLEPADNPADPCAWGRCHPVVVMPDGWEWGGKERPPWNLVIRITDMTVEEVLPYVEPDVDATDPANKILRAIRKHKFDLDDVAIPPAVQAAIDAGEIFSCTKAQIVAFIKRTL